MTEGEMKAYETGWSAAISHASVLLLCLADASKNTSDRAAFRRAAQNVKNLNAVVE